MFMRMEEGVLCCCADAGEFSKPSHICGWLGWRMRTKGPAKGFVLHHAPRVHRWQVPVQCVRYGHEVLNVIRKVFRISTSSITRDVYVAI